MKYTYKVFALLFSIFLPSCFGNAVCYVGDSGVLTKEVDGSCHALELVRMKPDERFDILYIDKKSNKKMTGKDLVDSDLALSVKDVGGRRIGRAKADFGIRPAGTKAHVFDHFWIYVKDQKIVGMVMMLHTLNEDESKELEIDGVSVKGAGIDELSELLGGGVAKHKYLRE